MKTLRPASRCAALPLAALVATGIWAGGVRLTAQGDAPGEGQARPAYALTTAVVQALSIAQSIEQVLDRVDRNRLADPSARFEGTSAARTAMGRAQEAASLLGRPIASADDPVRRSAGAFRGVFSTISMQMNDAIGQWDKLSRSDNENDTSDAERALASVFADERPWQMLQQASRDLTTLLVANDRLVLTRTERETLLAELNKAFPRLGTSGRGGGHAHTAAAVLHELLARPTPSADE